MPTIRGKFYDRRQPLVRARLSNDVPQFEGDEQLIGPAAQRGRDIWALIDTGATTSVIDLALQKELLLPQQGSKPVLFPNMLSTEFHPTYTCEISFFEHHSEESKRHEWSDLLEMLSFDLSSRVFQAVIGMDVLAFVDFTMNNGSPQLAY